LKSKRNIFITGVVLTVVVGMFGFISTFAIFKVIAELKNGIPFTNTMFVVPLIFYPIVIYTIFYLLTYFPSITIDKSGTEFSTIFRAKNYSWSEIKEIQLTGKRPHKFMFISMPVEATTILLNDNSVIYIWVDYYSNKSELRVILDRANKILHDNKKMTTLDFDINRPNHPEYYIDDNDAKEFNGNHLLTSNGLFFYGWLGFIGFMVYLKPQVFLTNLGAIISISLATIVFSISLSYQMHYFKMTNKYLVVKNSIWFWRNDVYLLSDIREVVIESPRKLSKSLRVITNDFQGKLYPSGNLRKSTWIELIEQLKAAKIEIRNETI
jgi:hypothetical protein